MATLEEALACLEANPNYVPSDDEFKQFSLLLSAEILAASGGGAVPISPVELVEYDYTLVTNAYTEAFPNALDLRFVQVINYLDVPIYLSLNGTDNHFVINPNNSQNLGLVQNGMVVDTSLYVKYKGADAPTFGFVAFSASE